MKTIMQTTISPGYSMSTFGRPVALVECGAIVGVIIERGREWFVTAGYPGMSVEDHDVCIGSVMVNGIPVVVYGHPS